MCKFFVDEFRDSALGGAPAKEGISPWNAWDDWKAYNLDAPYMIPQGSVERVHSGKIGWRKTCVVRPGT